jgi:polyisoprenoid-binding protein YceI
MNPNFQFPTPDSQGTLCRTNLLGSWKLGVGISFALVITTAAAGSLRVTQGDVSVKCPMTIGGSFDAKTNALSGTITASAAQPSSLEGSLAVDLRTIDTGISLRNDHLREKYLEVERGAGYDKAVLSAIALKGLNPDAPEGKGSFTGSLTLHGVTKTVSGPVEVRKAGAGLRVKAAFPVNLPDYNIPEPRYLGVGVKNTVQVDVTFTTTP